MSSSDWKTYFYVESFSPIASPLVIAPKATKPFIRFCGDYVQINKYIKFYSYPIPHVRHEIDKIQGFKVYADLDLTNSFHQLPLDEESQDLLTVQTPWGLYKPKFLPEGVSIATCELQRTVAQIFGDKVRQGWLLVIFDNILVLANDYDELYQKLEEVLDTCIRWNLVLKF